MISSVIAKIDLDDMKEYHNKTVTTKIKTRKYSVKFRVAVDEYNMNEAVKLAKSDSNIIMLAYDGVGYGLKNLTESLDGVYFGWVVPVKLNVTEEDIKSYLSFAKDGVSIIFKVPDEYKDIEFMYKMMEKYPNIRFCGGKAFCFDECRFGCCGRDICQKAGIQVTNKDYWREGCCCALDVYNADELVLSVTEKVTSAKSGKKLSSEKKSSSKAKPQMFTNLLYGNGKVDL